MAMRLYGVSCSRLANAAIPWDKLVGCRYMRHGMLQSSTSMAECINTYGKGQMGSLARALPRKWSAQLCRGQFTSHS